MKSGESGLAQASEACLKFQAELPAYFEGESSAEVAAHAAVCAYCKCLLTDLENIRAAGSEAALDEPSPAVWARVREGLLNEGLIRIPADVRPARSSFKERWFPWKAGTLLRYPAPIAAAAIVAVVILFRVPGYLAHSPMQSANTLHPAAFMQSDVAPQDIAALRQTIDQLDAAYQANQSSLDPGMRATYEKSLASLNAEITECRASMKKQPQDGLTQNYLSQAYVEKAQVLQTALEYNLR